jgi:hypothetical protein
MKASRPMPTRPSTANTRATMISGSWREASDTAAPQPASISTQSSSEPSCPPQTAEKRYRVGNWVLECWAT